MRHSIATTLIALSVTAFVTPAVAQDAAEVVARFTEASGGLEAIRDLDSLRKNGIYVYNGLEHPVVVLQQRGGGCREEVEGLTQWGTAVDEGKVVVRAWDGQTAWIGVKDSGEAQAMPSGEVPGFLLDARIEPSLIEAAAKGHRVEVVGSTDVDGMETVEVALTHVDGTTERWYLDAGTHLPVMRTTEAPENEYKAAMTWYFDDYREVAGVQLPFYVMIEEPLFSREYIFDSIEANVGLDDGAFSPPGPLGEPDS